MTAIAARAADEKPAGQAVKTEETVPAEEGEMTREEIATRLQEIFQYNPDVRSAVSGLEVIEGEEGITFMYQGQTLEELDRETLFGLLRAANSQLSLRNYERMQRQLRDLKRIDDLNRTQRMLQQQRNLKAATRNYNTTPKVYTPPKIPKIPKPYRSPTGRR